MVSGSTLNIHSLLPLYDAIEAGVAALDDPALKERIDGLKVIRDQAAVDAERAQALLDSSGQNAVSPGMVRKFAQTARQRMRLPGGAAIGGIICARWHSASRSPTTRFVSWDRRATC